MTAVVLPFLWFIAVGLVAWVLYSKFFRNRKPGQAVAFSGPEIAALIVLTIYIGINIGMVIEVLIIAAML